MPSEKLVYDPNPAISKKAYITSIEQYQVLHKQSLEQPQEFWSKIGKQFHWETPADPKNFFSYNFDISKGPISIKWMEGATTNICYNLLDRNVRSGLADSVAFYWYVG